MPKPRRLYTREFKEAVVRRMLASANVSALARELRIPFQVLYRWRHSLEPEGPEGLRGPGQRRKAATLVGPAKELAAELERLAALERKVCQRSPELASLRQARRQVEAARRTGTRCRVTASTRSATRCRPRCRKALLPSSARVSWAASAV